MENTAKKKINNVRLWKKNQIKKKKQIIFMLYTNKL